MNTGSGLGPERRSTGFVSTSFANLKSKGSYSNLIAINVLDVVKYAGTFPPDKIEATK